MCGGGFHLSGTWRQQGESGGRYGTAFLPPLATPSRHKRELSPRIGSQPAVASISHKATVGKVQLLGVGGTSVPRDRRPRRGHRAALRVFRPQR